MAGNEHFIKLLEEKVNEIEDVVKVGQINRALQWKNEVLMILDNLISEESKYYKQLDYLSFSPSVIIRGDDDNSEEDRIAVQEDMEAARSILTSIIYGIKNNLIK